MTFLKHIALTAIISLMGTLVFSQTIGGRDNSELTPKTAEATKLSGGSFTGDVNTMTGELATSISLGSVSTPSGLGYSLSLDYTSSFSMSATQPMTAGIPYGDGWGPNIPTISIESDVFRKFSCGTLDMYAGNSPAQGDVDFGDATDGYSASDEGDFYWFSPQINIPGVASGRAIFKYVDVADQKCLVFALNKFETSVEIRFYGSNGWEVRLANGDTYKLKTHLANYAAPSSQRVLHYDQTSLTINNDQEASAVNNAYSNPYEIQNVVEPKSTYSVWYCDKIHNTNYPDQVVVFAYNKFGEFSFFEEFNQDRYQEVRQDVFLTSTNTDFSAYTDVFLSSVYSAVSETPVDIIELEFDTYDDVVDNATILDGDHPDVFQKDGLYNYTIVEEWDGISGTNSFTSWKRYKHIADHDNNYGVNSTNPYLTMDGSNSYKNEDVTTTNEAAFDHGFLESERLFSNGMGYYPGDIYEVKTSISRESTTDLDMGNGILDIAIKSGTMGNGPTNENVSPTYGADGTTITATDYETRKGLEVFSTFNSAVKWQMGHSQNTLETSNLFVMPNLPGSYYGFNIQIGPGNSDINFGANTENNTDLVDNGVLNTMNAYPFAHIGRTIKSSNQISHSFGTGHPWGMMIPQYNEMALNSANPLTGSAASPEELYETWWATDLEITNGRSNIPTKFDETVTVDKVQFIRYSKNALMLQGVKVYKVNGEFKGMQDATKSGWQLVSEKNLDYTYHSEKIVRNYNYQTGQTIVNEALLLRKVILLDKVEEIPVVGTYTPEEILTTFLEYEKFIDSDNATYTYDQTKPYQALNQYLLTSYTDHLGGITRVEYYPVEDDETRIQNNYAFTSCSNYIDDMSDNNAASAQPFGKNTSFTVHAAVHYLAKNDEGDELLNSSNLLNGNNVLNPDLKVWEYEYDVNTLMLNPRKFDLPQAHFRHHQLFGDENAFKNVRVYSPYVNSTDAARNYTDYEYYGAVGGNPTIEDYLFYGKIKSVKNYSLNDDLEDETIFNYEYTLAFTNGYERPNFMRERLWVESLVAQNYEYQDIYENDVMEYDDGITVHVGEQAYSHQDVPNFSGNYTDKEKPKFMEFYFYNEMKTLNNEFQFHSYFIKKANEINRLYDNSLAIYPTPNPPVIGVTEMPADNPFGTGNTNPTDDDEEVDEPLISLIGQMTDEELESEFIDNSPLSDAVLIALVQSGVRGSYQTNILKAQGNLSNAVWAQIILNKRNFATSQLKQVIGVQSYLSDQVLIDYLNASSSRDDYVLANYFLKKNAYLSGQVVTHMLLPQISLPAESFSQVLASQPQMPESTLIAIINSANTKSINISSVLSDQFITNVMYTHILNNTTYTNENVTELVEVAIAFPIDLTLIEFIEHTPQFSADQLERIFDQADREIGDEVVLKLGMHYALPDKEQIIGDLVIGNSLSQYCGGAVIEGRSYFETKTEYEYYEANEQGIAVGQAYEILLGLKQDALAASPFPFTTNPAAEGLSVSAQTVTGLSLKHEPSWQLFSVKTTSPHMNEAYSREEYFYLYDLKNRYDRHWYYYDLDHPTIDYIAQEYTIGTGNDAISQILVTNDNWDYYYGSQFIPELPPFDGMAKTRTHGDRVTAFQKTTISKNTRDTEPKYRSEFYQYDSRWIFDDANGNAQTIEINEPCITPPNPPSDPCTDYEDCSDCNYFFYKPFMEWASVVPMGYCAWEIPGMGYYICPSEHSSQMFIDHPNAVNMYCETIPQANQALQPSAALKDALLLRNVIVQVDDNDHSSTQEFDGSKLDGNNMYVAEFYMGSPNQLDANNFERPHHMIVPFDHLTVRTIKERNRYLQVELEENAVGLQTKYFFNSNTWLWNVDANCPANNFTSRENIDIGLPTQIVVGYTKTDALATNFEYTEIGQVKKVTEPNGKTMEYFFDNYHRLFSVTEDGNRLLSRTEYNLWDHNDIASFDERTDMNYVHSWLYNSDAGYDLEESVAFVDPLGRNQGVAAGYNLDANNAITVHSGFVTYDNWGRVVTSEKAYINSQSSTSTITPYFAKSQSVANPIEELIIEGGAKGRSLRSSNFDVDVNGVHAVKMNYHITNNIYASCELDLSLFELEQVMSPNGTTNFRMYRSEVFDQDDKQSIDYTNALGQKVAQLRYNDGGQKIVTLFAYDSYGNLTKVINPEKQQSDYVYNKLGQLIIENTVDAGARHIMYNKLGLPSVVLDEQGRNNLDGLGAADPFYRVFEYDDYGRITKQGRSTLGNEFHSMTYNGELYGPLQYEDAFVGIIQGVEIIDPITSNEVYFDYTFSDAQSADWLYQFDFLGQSNIEQANGLAGNEMSVDFREKTMMYGTVGNLNELGKLKLTYSYNENDQHIQSVNYEYDLYGNINKQTVSFNAAGGTLGGPASINSIIEYPSYNYRHSLLEQKIDVDGDAVVDFHCFMEYDALNRLTHIYGAAGAVANETEATLLVTYAYDDAIGAVDKKVHYIQDQGLAAIATEIAYQYDERDRLTNIKAGQLTAGMQPLMDYELYYDDALVNYNDGVYSASANADQNWNGNINGTHTAYDFTSNMSIANNVSGFDLPTVYGYSYDGINRMVAADGIIGDLLDAGNLAESYMIGDVTLMYDRIGNIQSLHRTLRNTDMTPGADYTMLQHFNYQYGTDNNRLMQAAGVAGSGTTSRNYTYDDNGNILTDDSKGLMESIYGRASYPMKLSLDPDNISGNLDDESIWYLYSANDLRVYKKNYAYNLAIDAFDTHEDYYLMDAMGRTVAIFKNGFNGNGWEYYVSGSEREARIVPTAAQAPGGNTNENPPIDPNDQNDPQVAIYDSYIDAVQIGKDQATFFVNDHLGNTRITYTPTSTYGTPNVVLNDAFNSGSLDSWMANEVTITNVSDALQVETDVNASWPIISKVGSNTTLIDGQTYVMTLNADLGDTPNGVTFEILNAGVSFELTQGLNTHTFTANYSNSSVNPVFVFKLTGYNGSSTPYTYTLDNISIGQQLEVYTINTINYVGDYFPYGKVVREFVEGDAERYISTQHERDSETGFDYRGARYYDSDVARFLSLDPLAAEFVSWSPYNYVLANPIKLIDPDGKSATDPGTKTEKGVNGTKLLLPDNATVTGRFVDSDGNGKINYGKTTLEASAGEVRTFEADGVGYKANFKDDGSFNGYWDGNGNKWKNPDPSSATNKPFQLPEFSPEVGAGVLLSQTLLQASALETANGSFKYIEASGTAKDSHIVPANGVFKVVGNIATVYTVADKAVLTVNAVMRGDYEEAADEGVCMAGYTAAGVMMATPTGVTQIAGAGLFLLVGIYDIFGD